MIYDASTSLLVISKHTVWKAGPPGGLLKHEYFESYSWYIPRAAEVWESESEKGEWEKQKGNYIQTKAQFVYSFCLMAQC